jgi:uncharacterized protein (TIGR00251 family)
MVIYKNIVKKHNNGTTIDIFTTTYAKKCIFPAGFNKWRKRIEIKVRAKAQDNQANLEVIKTVAEFFSKPIKNINIISGDKTREKTILIKDISEKTTIKKLKEGLNGF